MVQVVDEKGSPLGPGDRVCITNLNNIEGVVRHGIFSQISYL